MDFSKLQTTSKVTDEWAYPQGQANRSGLLQVDSAPDHKLYWEEYGNPDGSRSCSCTAGRAAPARR